MPYSQPTRPHSTVKPRVIAATQDDGALLRGLVNGVILSVAIWTALGWVTFALR